MYLGAMLRAIRAVIFFVVGLMLSSNLAQARDDVDNSYRLGKGYAVGNTGWRLGGYASAEVVLPSHSPVHAEVNDLSLFLTWDNGSRLRFFSELEVGDIVSINEHKDPHFEFERFYLDGLVSNNLTIRLGKFLTPVGQWNVIHAAPLVWTTFRPVATENLFSTKASGLMLHGSVPVAGHQLDYAVYGDVSPHIDPALSDNPFENALGARLRYAFTDKLQFGASYANFELKNNHSTRYSLVGLDLAWTYKKFELNSEVVHRASHQAHAEDYWQGYVQGVQHLTHQWSVVGRYEFFQRPQDAMGQVGLLGLAYRPLPALIGKLEYRLGTHNDKLAPDGLAFSLSVLF
jgi:hypothetical protein